ncbi:hypothetical protein [Acinetobacter pragensis]|uniref:DUF3298 domain-containing protein n=1 Tax=Acinetobacter pragensis TaxID=1806892 RepID=A0A151Y4X4_9GAMM|nr:hypothetical protein [Acinetobacter pragensis]KYQ73083.1 hypothetical protein AZH43_06495 [Acinetobacter pragensis]
MNIIKDAVIISMLGMSLLLSACDDSKKPQQPEAEKKASVFDAEKSDVLPYLNIQEQPAKVALPFCENKNCIDLNIQTVQTADPWLNTWIERNQALVVQDQIKQKQSMSLQQAINAYVKKSDAWQDEFKTNQPYALTMYTRIPYQRNQYVLLQVGVDTAQENIKVKDRHYFFVADRRTQKSLALLDIVDAQQQAKMNGIVQAAYAKWLKEQDAAVRQSAPKKLYWGQADWFFDQEGVGLHYRTHEIVKDGAQLDIYLTKQQTQQVLKDAVYRLMF